MDHKAWLNDKAWNTAPGTHHAKSVVFHDDQAIICRFQNQNISNAGGYYYQHWVNCYNHFGAANDHCRKCRWVAEQYAERRQIDEWDDWVKEEHFDIGIGQHANKIDAEHFTEAANALKALREKRDELVKVVSDKLIAKAAEDPMFKVRTALGLLTGAARKDGIKAAIQEGLIGEDDVQAAIKAKVAQLKALSDDSKWNSVKSGLKDEITKFAKTTKPRLLLAKSEIAKFRAEVKAAGEVAFDIPHFKLDFEKPGFYEYTTWFGKYVPRTWQYGYVAPPDED